MVKPPAQGTRNKGSIFGAGLYLSAEFIVAEANAPRPRGVVYLCTPEGSPDKAIWLDGPLRTQSPLAQEFLVLNARAQGQRMRPEASARDLLHAYGLHHNEQHRHSPAATYHDDLRHRLRAHGIWMLFGNAHPMEHAGLMDRGIQYMVIDNAAINWMGPVDARTARSLSMPEPQDQNPQREEVAFDDFGL